ncbi:protoporphyrinogen oxidase [Microbacterium sp. cx-55]|uniref:protoporphyrinogen oxidase n=1 Tax=Microbacterium sp. cx-55 TaxID=2875948 RepID=UPI001CBFCA36|nr:protoporphyrinogen oxidase [Microbacterium sp. cx-55]MBZ4488298.1 protoporphyrinogen oxidase [Microbacterium sp. cx-55]UGB34958.1 protoporphyrinogen oxidase [Microbacterium sp. cx-55]
MTEPLPELIAHARDTRVVVVGGGVGGLVAALELAKVGMPVTVLEGSDRVGGVLRSAEVAGLRLDVGAESYATRGGHVRALIDELGLANAVVSPSAHGAWVTGLPGGGAAPMPAGGVLGIPDNPWDPAVRRVIGWGGVWRAYLDRLRPPLTIGHDRSLGTLVRSRLGAKVLDRLVAPVTSGVYSARPDDIDVDIAAPGLNAALTRAGSLTGAVAQLRGGRRVVPGGAVAGLDGGMTRLVDALIDQLTLLGVDIRTETPVAGIDRVDDAWVVRAGDDVPADVVIVAVPEAEARRMLTPLVPALDARTAEAPVVEIVTLVLAASVLDAHPRGNGVLTVPHSSQAKALTHATAKWDWVARAAGQGVHVVRVSFGAQGEAPATETLDDADAAALALREASVLLGVPLDATQLRGAHRERYVQSQPGSVIGRAAAMAAARGAIRAVPGLGAVGAWLSGTGLAQVVPDAIGEADRVRRAALFGSMGSAPRAD